MLCRTDRLNFKLQIFAVTTVLYSLFETQTISFTTSLENSITGGISCNLNIVNRLISSLETCDSKITVLYGVNVAT